MTLATFRFYEELNDFLPEAARKADVDFFFNEETTIGAALEAFGVPREAVELILVNSESVDFSCILAQGDRVLEVLAVEQLHGHEGLVALGAELVDGDDVRVAQQRDRLGLAHEALADGLVRVEAGRDALDGDVAVEHGVVGTEDFAHGALSELAGDLVLADLLGRRHAVGRAAPRS